MKEHYENFTPVYSAISQHSALDYSLNLSFPYL